MPHLHSLTQCIHMPCPWWLLVCRQASPLHPLPPSPTYSTHTYTMSVAVISSLTSAPLHSLTQRTHTPCPWWWLVHWQAAPLPSLTQLAHTLAFTRNGHHRWHLNVRPTQSHHSSSSWWSVSVMSLTQSSLSSWETKGQWWWDVWIWVLQANDWANKIIYHSCSS